MRKISHWWIIFLLLTKVKHLNGSTSTTDSGAISSVTTTVLNETSSQPMTPTTSFAQNATSISSTSTISTASSDNPTYTSSPTHLTSTTFRPTTVTVMTTTLTTNPMSSSTNAKDNGSPTAETTGTDTASSPSSTTPVSTNETSTNASTSSVTVSESSSIASTSPSPSTTSSNEITTPFSTSSSVETVSTAIITTTPLSQTTSISDNTISISQTTPISDNTTSSSQTTSISDNTTSSSQTTSISDNTTSSIESTTGAVATSTTDSDTTITTSVQSSSEYATTSQPHATSSVSFKTSTKQPTTTSSITPPSTTTTTTTTTTSAIKSTATPEQQTPGKTTKTPSIKDQELYYAASGAAVVVLAVVVILVLVLVKTRRRHKWCFSTDVELYKSFDDSMELDYIHFRPGPVKLQDFPTYLDKLHRNDGLLFVDAFTLLHDESPPGVASAAMLENNEDKNRYVNILAFDHSRVKLRQINDDQTTDYINANFIPGYTYRREYIATQGPLPNTLDDFWRMIWEQNVEIIVMVTKLVENGNPKCDKYWPDIGNVSVHGDFTVTTKTEINSKFTLRTLEMTMAGEKPRSIRQYAFLLWPDMGVPETPSALLEFVQAVRSGAPRKEAAPIVVHCSAGVGRTGTFIAVDHLLQMIRNNDEIDVFGQVLEMRKYRASMVQTEAQFVYIYDCIKDFMMTDDEHGEATEDEDENIKEDEKVEADRTLKPALGQDNPAFEDTAD